jgi:hypothetical protein
MSILPLIFGWAVSSTPVDWDSGVGGTGVSVGGGSVSVGGTGVSVGGIGVAVSLGVPQALTKIKIIIVIVIVITMVL